MCTTCECSLTDVIQLDPQVADNHLIQNPQLNDPKTLMVINKILKENDLLANRIRAQFEEHNITAFNIMSSPGSGKTTLLEHLKDHLYARYSVIEGDLETNRDADRLIAKGIPAIQIQTGSACHLDASMIANVLPQIDMETTDICFIENVGNLVCPASYDVGAHKNIVLVSVPEGDDKIEKYPVMFRRADLVLFTKSDLFPYFEFDIKAAAENVKKINPEAQVMALSVRDASSMHLLSKWIIKQQKAEK